MKKKIAAFVIMLIMLFSVCSVTASAYDRELLNSITANYDKALSIAGRGSFHGKCNLATAYQLRAMGIYADGLDYSGTGSSWHAYFRNVSGTTGGYNIVTISGANCLNDLVDRYGDEIYNVVYCLGTGGTSGGTHVLYIRAIIDGYVYFADSFGTSYYHTYYGEGEGTVLSLPDFISAYRRMNGNAYGCVYFTKNNVTEHLSGSTENPADWADDKTVYETGRYVVSAVSLKVREKPNTHAASTVTVPHGSQLTVSEIRNNWGFVEFDGKKGWICLTYTQKLSEVTNTDGSLCVASLSPDKQAVFNNQPITWTATVQGGTGNRYFYSFYVYKDNMKVYAGTYCTENSVTFTPDSKGTYKASVTVMDVYGNTTTHTGEDVVCVGEEMILKNGDFNGDGIITSDDVKLSARMLSAMETLTGKNFICADFDKDGIMRKQSEKLFNEDANEAI